MRGAVTHPICRHEATPLRKQQTTVVEEFPEKPSADGKPGESARSIERAELLMPPDRLLADEDLRHGATPCRRHEPFPRARISGDVDLLEGDATRAEQLLGMA